MPHQDASNKRLIRLLLVLLVLLLIGGSWLFYSWGPQPQVATMTPTNALRLIIDLENQAEDRYWKPEIEARQRARPVEALWNEINRTTNKLAVFQNGFVPAEIKIPIFDQEQVAPLEIHRFSGGTSQTLQARGWSSLLQRLAREGWELTACEARFIGIQPDTFYVAAHLVNPAMTVRAVLEGNVVIEFGSGERSFVRVDASKLELRTRQGAPLFSQMFHADVSPHAGSFFIDPVIVWDLDSDGQFEVILAAANVVIRREANGRWRPDLFCRHDPGLIFTGLMGDFTGDGISDFVCAKFEGLVLYDGRKGGQFPDASRPVWTAQPRLRYAQSITAGDVDGDGDLDLFLGQYKLPYTQGQMPFPYFDANDGFPSFLLLNDGKGNFTDATQNSGLAAKRGRRVYSASLVDLDSDRDLDLVLVSDFAGLDAFENDGKGNFSDATNKWFDDTHGFGMAHTFSDFNADGRLDLLMIAMNSPTADRLHSQSLNRPYDMSDTRMRSAVTFGNRLFFGQLTGKFQQEAIGRQLARTGWSWGAAAGDLDNDGFPEIYIANGHDSRELVEEYEPEFWLHDIYIGNSQENYLADAYFRQKFANTRGKGYSYGGHERNRLFLNQGGTNFVEAAHLLGVGMVEDSRNVAMADLDGDGNLDLIVTTFETFPQTRQSIRFFRNLIPPAGESKGIQLLDPKKTGLTGRFISGRTNAFALTSGESYRTQVQGKARMGAGKSGVAPKIIGATNVFEMTR